MCKTFRARNANPSCIYEWYGVVLIYLVRTPARLNGAVYKLKCPRKLKDFQTMPGFLEGLLNGFTRFNEFLRNFVADTV